MVEMKKMLFVLILVIVLCATAEKQETPGNYDEKAVTGCLARKGRDGLPGPPGTQGLPGERGRDGRDCLSGLPLTRILDLEKRYGELSVKCQFAELETKKLITDFVYYQSQIRKLLKALTEKRIINSYEFETESDVKNSDTILNKFKVMMAKLNMSNGANEELIDSDKKAQGTKIITTIGNSDGDDHGDGRKHLGKSPGIIDDITPSLVPPSTHATTTSSACDKRFVLHQQLNIHGTVNVEYFTIGKQRFLAIASFYLTSNEKSRAINSMIYRMNDSGHFEFYQNIPTFACRALVPFTSKGGHYMVAVNHYNGITYSLPSTIFKWNGTHFKHYLNISTYGASSVQFFTIKKQSYLVFANYRNQTSVSIMSEVYKWNDGNIQLFQGIATDGAVDCKIFQPSEGDTLLVFASFFTPKQLFDVQSTVYQWNGRKFVNIQQLPTKAAVHVDMFEYKSELYLAFASKRGKETWHSHSLIFKWNGRQFQRMQDILTTGAVKVHHFVDDNNLYLVLANHFDELLKYQAYSSVYKLKNKQFEKIQEIPTIGSYDLKPFHYEGDVYLATALFTDRMNNTTDQSPIYKFIPSCEKDNFSLP